MADVEHRLTVAHHILQQARRVLAGCEDLYDTLYAERVLAILKQQPKASRCLVEQQITVERSYPSDLRDAWVRLKRATRLRDGMELLYEQRKQEAWKDRRRLGYGG